MQSKRVAICVCLLTAGLLQAAPVPPKTSKKEPSGVAKLKQSLQIAVTADFTKKSLVAALNELKKLTKVEFAFDQGPMMQTMGWLRISANGRARGLTPNLKVKQKPLGEVLTQVLRPYQLTYVLTNDRVLVTTQSAALYRQLEQEISVDFKKTPLSKAIAQLEKETAARLVLDPSITGKNEPTVTLKLKDVSVDTALRLLSAMAGTQAVAVGKVVFITTEKKAAILQKQKSIAKRPPSAVGPPGSMPPGIGIGIGGIPGGAPGGGPFPGPGGGEVPPDVDPAVPPGGGGAPGGVPPPIPGGEDGRPPADEPPTAPRKR